ncbi:hypothetical protein VB741_20065 [Leptothoe sp. PORK10 BA2]|nr:hypothetical protein [Leptothoe sp. PORK10 BA2]MEA5466032.1 hypothetical protein [Leptothoe sp. PORK10 BA2]
MKSTYSFFTRATHTPQTQPIPGHETDMVQGRSGGYQYKINLWQQLRRCLLLGTAQGSFYADKHELTEEFAHVVNKAVATDPERTAKEILYASNGHAINNSAPLFALVLFVHGRNPRR